MCVSGRGGAEFVRILRIYTPSPPPPPFFLSFFFFFFFLVFSFILHPVPVSTSFRIDAGMTKWLAAEVITVANLTLLVQRRFFTSWV